MRAGAIKWAALALALAGCTSTADGSEPESAGEVAAGSAPAAEEPFFAEEQVEDDDCKLLTLEDASAATGIPQEHIEQLAVSGCIYTWDDGEGHEDGTLWLAMVRPYETMQRARSTFARHTEDVTAHQVGEAKDQAKQEYAKKRAEGELTEDEEAIGSALTDAMPEVDFTHQVIEGLGTEAAMDDRGSAWIRYGNVLIHLTAKRDGEDVIEAETAAEAGRRIIARLDAGR